MAEQHVITSSIPKPGYESSGVNVRGVLLFITWFVISAVAIAVILWLTFGVLNHHIAGFEPRPSPIGSIPPNHLAQPLQPSPGHPTLPWQDVAQMKQTQRAILNSYGPIPNEPACVHLPIGRAMQLLLESGELKIPPKVSDTQPYINTTQPAPTENRS